MIADTPPTHGIDTAVIRYNWRGGHAVRPKRLAHLTITVGDSYVAPAVSAKCRVAYSQVTLAGRRLGVISMRTAWCAA